MEYREEESYKQILTKHYDEIFYYVYNQLGNTEDARDLTQDIFVKAYSKFNRYDKNKSSMRTWLYRIAQNHCLDYFRSAYFKHQRKDTSFDLEIADESDVLETLIQSEQFDKVIRVMKTVLNLKHQKIMNYFFFSELSQDEIADLMEIPKKTVYNVINESLKKLKSKLEGEYNE